MRSAALILSHLKTDMATDINTSAAAPLGLKLSSRERLARARGQRIRCATVAPKIKVIPVDPPRRKSLGERIAEAAYVVFERSFAATALVLGSPILLIEAILIKLDSPGPVFFHHERAAQSVPTLGRNIVERPDLQSDEGGYEPDKLYWVPRPFRFVKFRTMHHDALEKHPELYWWNYDITEEEFANIYHNLDDDPRVTRIGKILRKTSLDEIVNFWHVLTGECRLVGPRPEIVDILPYYTAEEMLKFTVKPGITCLWAIRGRSELSVREKNQHDIEYVRTRTVWLDLKILFLTAWCVLLRRGAY